MWSRNFSSGGRTRPRLRIAAGSTPHPWCRFAVRGASMLEAVHLVKRFSGVTVVNDVSFELRPGEVVGYLGPNGSGKTTTTRMLTGLLEPTSGQVLLDGRRLGYVPEEPHLYPFLSGREYLELVGRLRELPAALLDKKIGAMLELFGLQ